jgi:hypothetical protein
MSRRFYLIGFAALYLPIVCAEAAVRPFWFDELFTVYLSRLPGLREIWTALESGVDTNPPLNCWLTHWAISLLGENHLAARLPAILGFLLMSLCVFRFVGKRLPPGHAAMAMLFLILSGAWGYASEARPYGLMLGFSGLALALWQEAAERTHRRALLAALALTVAAAAWSHYYAVFTLIPIAVGEAWRWRTRRRFDPWIWVSLFAGLLPLAFLIPLVRGANAGTLGLPLRSPAFWAKPTLNGMTQTYIALFALAIPACAAALAIAWLATLSGNRGRATERPALPGHELAAAAGFLLIPIVLTVFTRIFTGYYLGRYALATAIGGAILLAAATARCLPRPRSAMLAAIVLAAVFVGTRGWKAAEGLTSPQPSVALQTLARKGDRNLPIAVANPLLFLQLTYYAPAELRARLVYLSDPSVVVQYPDFVPELCLRALRRWTPLPVKEYRSFLAAHPHFLVDYSGMKRIEWLVPQLDRDGCALEPLAQDQGETLLDVFTGRK